MLSTLAAQPPASVRITLVSPHARQMYSGMVPGFVAGHYALNDCVIELAPLLANSGVTWLARSASALDAQTCTVTLDDGSTLGYDVLSINTGPIQDRQKIEAMMPGAREHALFVRPIEAFAAMWPQVQELAQARPLRIAVVGAGAAGIELAMAVAHRLPSAAITLLSGDAVAAANYPLPVQHRILSALKRRRITVLQERVTGVTANDVLLGSGAQLACDVPLIAIGTHAPTWLQTSGLALDAQGFMAVDACQRSTSHPLVFAAGDVSTRIDHTLPKSGVYAVRAGPPLADNLRAVLAGVDPKPYTPQQRSLNLISCGDHRAIASWGNWTAQGRWVWWLKDWIDRGFVKKYRQPQRVTRMNLL